MAVAEAVFKVRREFTAGGSLLERGTRLVDPQFKNLRALVETGYLMPVQEEPAAPAPPAPPPAPASDKHGASPHARARRRKGA